MNLKLTNFENLTQGRVGFIPWKWQVVYVITRLVVHTFSKAHPYIQHICVFQQ